MIDQSGDVAKQVENVVEGTRKANISNKLDYLFGKATGNKHNIDRSTSMFEKMKSIGIHDTSKNRAFLAEYFDDVLNDSTNILKTEEISYIAKELPSQPTMTYTATTRQSLLMGQNGGVMVESVWDGDRLLSMILRGSN